MVKDFTVKISPYSAASDVATNIATNGSSGTSYDSEWSSITVTQKMNSPSVFNVRFKGVVCSSALPVSVRNVLGVYYDGSLVFIGMVSNVSYENYNTLSVDGFDFSFLLMAQCLTPPNLFGINTDSMWHFDHCSTLSELLSAINSPTDNKGWTDGILPAGTIASINLNSGERKLPIMTRGQALFYVAQNMSQNLYFYINELTGSINASTTRGTSTAVNVGGQDGYYLTGVKTNAYLGMRHYTGLNIINKITVIGHDGKTSATYSDYTTKETTLTSGDQRLIYKFIATGSPAGPCGWDGSNGIMQLHSVEGLPNSGKVVLRNGTITSGYSIRSGNVVISYTGKSANTLTGCTVDTGVVGTWVWEANSPVYVRDKIYVASTSDFANSGEIIIGSEVMTYTSKDATSFTLATDDVSAYGRYLVTTTDTTSEISPTATTIPCTSNSLSGWETAGFVGVGVGGEIIQYKNRTDTQLLNCQRDPLHAATHASSSLVIQTFYPEIHPAGVLVKQNTDGAVDATNSSIKVNGLCEKIVQEPNMITKEGVESYACQILRNHRWGDIVHDLLAQDVGGDFDLLYIGDKVTITDANIGVSASEARVQEMRLMLNRESGEYQLAVRTVPYDKAFNNFDFKISAKDYIESRKYGRWL